MTVQCTLHKLADAGEGPLSCTLLPFPPTAGIVGYGRQAEALRWSCCRTVTRGLSRGSAGLAIGQTRLARVTWNVCRQCWPASRSNRNRQARFRSTALARQQSDLPAVRMRQLLRNGQTKPAAAGRCAAGRFQPVEGAQLKGPSSTYFSA